MAQGCREGTQAREAQGKDHLTRRHAAIFESRRKAEPSRPRKDGDMSSSAVPFNKEIWISRIFPILSPRYLARAIAVSKGWAKAGASHVMKLIRQSKLTMLPGLGLWYRLMVR